MDKALKAVAIYLAWMLATMPIFPQQILAPIMSQAPAAGAAACGTSLTNNLGDFWAGSYSASPITTNWADSAGGTNLLAPTASPTWANNTFGTGLAGVTLNGTSQYFGMTSLVVPTSNFANMSMYMVVKVNAQGSITANSSRSGTSSTPLIIQLNASNKWELDRQGVTFICQTTSTIPTGVATEFAYTYNGSTANLYVNGTLDATCNTSASPNNGIDRVGGDWSGGSPSSFWNGSIYEIAFSSSTSYQSSFHTCVAALGLP